MPARPGPPGPGRAVAAGSVSTSSLSDAAAVRLAGRLGAPGAARPASSGTRAATGRRAGRRPGRARAARATARATGARRPSSPTGRRALRRRSGTDGDRQVVGADGVQLVPGEWGRHLGATAGPAPTTAPKTVLCGAFWLKSTKTRSPRSSFHQAAVIGRAGGAPAPGPRPPRPRAPRRTSQRGWSRT